MTATTALTAELIDAYRRTGRSPTASPIRALAEPRIYPPNIDPPWPLLRDLAEQLDIPRGDEYLLGVDDAFRGRPARQGQPGTLVWGHAYYEGHADGPQIRQAVWAALGIRRISGWHVWTDARPGLIGRMAGSGPICWARIEGEEIELTWMEGSSPEDREDAIGRLIRRLRSSGAKVGVGDAAAKGAAEK
ncbi:MAG: hypothetical protein Q8R92_14845 [Deltaproteobacteria bacterium]|nr:hypothetical protein [Deltaproteobacteria bacterium]